MQQEEETQAQFLRLRQVVRRLRQPDGCPWDRAQTHQSIKKNLVEETGEFLDALEEGNTQGMVEELGDVLLQVLFHSQMGEEEGAFSLEEVCRHEADKLIRRHTHVFGDAQAANDREALRNWENAKHAEGGEQARRTSALDGVSRSIPGLSRAQKTLVKACRVGFDWPLPQHALSKVEEELEEVREALKAQDAAAVQEELGDLLFAVVNLCRLQGVEAEEALHGAIRKFFRRFQEMERQCAAQGRPLEKNSPQEWMDLWREAKRKGL
ncbi:MAG: nucleoside triphosphate pyrophosphohydrolase [Oligosphaeraceae bacterium]